MKLFKEANKHLTITFRIALLITFFIIILAFIFPSSFQTITSQMRHFIDIHFTWYYLILVTAIVIISIILIFSPIGKIRLGDPCSKPEHSTFSWLAMLFSAGMGIGLVFYGAAEPLSHYAINSPEAELYSQQALRDAFKFTFFHYGIHAWSIYAIVALALAYFQFRKKEKTLISVTLKPLIGERVNGIIGKLIDALTIVATVAGVATTLGFGASQINGGISFLFGVPHNFRIQLLIIVIATLLFMTSALSGIGKGVKILSNINVYIAIALLILAMIVGSDVKMLNTFAQGLGDYFRDFLRLSLRTSPGNQNQQEWIRNWTIFYWAWWISWSPFVGIFIARISKGRTIREFLTFVILVPSLFSFLWFSVFGVMSTEAVTASPTIAELPLEQILFGTFLQYPLGFFMAIVAVILVFSFFITSADSATYVLAMQSEDGTLNPHNSVKIIWGVMLALIAIALMAAGGLTALQNVMILLAFPFSIIICFIIISLIIELKYEQSEMGLYIKPHTYPKKDEPFRSYENDEGNLRH